MRSGRASRGPSYAGKKLRGSLCTIEAVTLPVPKRFACWGQRSTGLCFPSFQVTPPACSPSLQIKQQITALQTGLSTSGSTAQDSNSEQSSGRARLSPLGSTSVPGSSSSSPGSRALEKRAQCCQHVSSGKNRAFTRPGEEAPHGRGHLAALLREVGAVQGTLGFCHAAGSDGTRAPPAPSCLGGRRQPRSPSWLPPSWKQKRGVINMSVKGM